MKCPKCGGEMTKVYWGDGWGWFICYHSDTRDYSMTYFEEKVI